MITAYLNGTVIFEDGVRRTNVYTRNGKITEISDSVIPSERTVDCRGLYLSPGFADIHVHGGGGYSAMSDDPEEIVKMCRAHALRGTTSIVPTTLAAPVARLQRAMDNIGKAKRMCEDANILGVHLEGPFLSMAKKGAQSPDNILIPMEENLSALLGHTTAYNEAGGRLLPADFPDELKGLFVPGSGDGAGINQVNIRRLVHGDDLIAIRLEKFQHGLGIILIDFTAKSMGSDGFHVYSISPYKHMMADTAASPAVSVRRIRFPRVTGTKPAA